MAQQRLRTRRPPVPALLAAVLHLLLGGLVAVSGLIMPGWAVVSLGLAWLVGAAALVRWRRRPAVVLAVPVAMLLLWLASAVAGDAWLGWTA
jgi:hypothetical protein